MQIKFETIYLVTTKTDRLSTDYQLVMIDSTAPEWAVKPGDLQDGI